MLQLADSLWTVLSDKAVVFWVIMGSVAVIWIVSSAISSVMQARAYEKTRREIAAYLAEGSIDKETALAMLKEGREGEEEA